MKLNQHSILWVCVLLHFFTSSTALLQVGKNEAVAVEGAVHGQGRRRRGDQITNKIAQSQSWQITYYRPDVGVHEKPKDVYKVQHSTSLCLTGNKLKLLSNKFCQFWIYELLQLWISDNSRTGHNDSTSSFSEKNIFHHTNYFQLQNDTKLENPTKLHVLESQRRQLVEYLSEGPEPSLTNVIGQRSSFAVSAGETKSGPSPPGVDRNKIADDEYAEKGSTTPRSK